MLDIETLDTAPTAVVLSIGAAVFDENGIVATYCAVLRTAEQQARGRTLSASTVQWWMMQSDAARAAVADEDRMSLHVQDALAGLSELIDKDTRIWANGANFDPVILESLYRSFGDRTPWHYANVRCCRTVLALAKGRVSLPLRSGTAHNALDDAIDQAQQVSQFLNVLDLWEGTHRADAAQAVPA